VEADEARLFARAGGAQAGPSRTGMNDYASVLLNAARIELVLSQPAQAIESLEQTQRITPPYAKWYLKYDPL